MSLPASYAWVIIGAPSGSSGAVFPIFPTAAGAGGMCNGTFHDQEYFLDLFDRILPVDYLAPLKLSAKGGYEIFQMAGLVGERLSLAVERLECGSFIIFAEGGTYATVTVQFYRATGTAGSVTVKAGSVVTTSNGQRDFVTVEDAVFAGAATGPISVLAQSIAQGWEWNVPGQVITPRGEVLAGEIDTCKKLIQDPAYGDPSIAVQQLVNATGGQAPMLDGLGADRGLARLPGEADDPYRYRLRTLPDTVSPGAVKRLIVALMAPYGLTADFIETWDVRYQTCWDGFPLPSPLPADWHVGYDANLFCYDDPRRAYGADVGHPVPPGLPFYNRWLDENEERGAFIVVVPVIPSLIDVGMAYDDTGVVSTDFLSPITGGRRATPAFDVPLTFSTGLGLQGGYDGFDVGRNAVYLGIWQALQDIKAGGVAAIVELRGN